MGYYMNATREHEYTLVIIAISILQALFFTPPDMLYIYHISVPGVDITCGQLCLHRFFQKLIFLYTIVDIFDNSF
jgi:hypothetical protein